jgi:glutamine synthetase
MTQEHPDMELEHYLEQHPETRYLEVLAPDICGVLRGKRVERSDFDKLFGKGVNHCGGTTLLNIKGAVPEYVDYGSNDGDPDVRGTAVAGSLAPVPWAAQPSAQCMMSLSTFAGEPYPFDPRNVLKRALQPLLDMGLNPVMATELEFYLVEHDGEQFQPRMPRIPGSALAQDGVQYATFEDLEEVDDFLKDVDAFCGAQNLPASAASNAPSAPLPGATAWRPLSWPNHSSNMPAAACTCTSAWSTPTATMCLRAAARMERFQTPCVMRSAAWRPV